MVFVNKVCAFVAVAAQIEVGEGLRMKSTPIQTVKTALGRAKNSWWGHECREEYKVAKVQYRALTDPNSLYYSGDETEQFQKLYERRKADGATKACTCGYFENVVALLVNKAATAWGPKWKDSKGGDLKSMSAYKLETICKEYNYLDSQRDQENLVKGLTECGCK